MTGLLAVTLGNSSVAVAAVDVEGALCDVHREPLPRLETLMAGHMASAGKGSGPVIVCSVNPQALERLRKTVADAGHEPPHMAGLDFPIPVATTVDEPDRVGPDRLLAALGAYRRACGACIVVDVGTAVTVNAIDDDGTFLGGAIFPGPDLMARSLTEGTARLPKVDMHAGGAMPESAVGRNTEEAIRVGVSRALSGGIGYLVTEMVLELDGASPVFLTGGGAADEEAAAADTDYVVAPDLVLEGLVLAWHERANR